MLKTTEVIRILDECRKYEDLLFWLKAVIHDGYDLMRARDLTLGCLKNKIEVDMQIARSPDFDGEIDLIWKDIRTAEWSCFEARENSKLKSYHFLCSIGRLARTIKQLSDIPENISKAINDVSDLMKEGKMLRDMFEHSDDYQAGKGRNYENYYRPSKYIEGGPGIDPYSTVTKNNGEFWLGDRLCVQHVIAGVSALYSIVDGHVSHIREALTSRPSR